jgi:hypothetical protein
MQVEQSRFHPAGFFDTIQRKNVKYWRKRRTAPCSRARTQAAMPIEVPLAEITGV